LNENTRLVCGQTGTVSEEDVIFLLLCPVKGLPVKK